MKCSQMYRRPCSSTRFLRAHTNSSQMFCVGDITVSKGDEYSKHNLGELTAGSAGVE